jgi:RNA polymerase sigma-70 factor (ECF subfamily)
MTDAASNEYLSAWMRAILDRYEGPLVGYATRLAGDVDRARDAVQETFLRFISDGAPRDDARVAQWLYTVCRNQVIDTHRKEKRMQLLTTPDATARAVDSLAPPDRLERLETQGQLVTLLSQLPDRQQEVVRLRFQHGLSYRQIAGVLELTETNVGWLLHTALKALREKMAAPAAATKPIASTMSTMRTTTLNPNPTTDTRRVQ